MMPVMLCQWLWDTLPGLWDDFAVESAEKGKSSVSEAVFGYLLPDAIEVGRDSSLVRSPGGGSGLHRGRW